MKYLLASLLFATTAFAEQPDISLGANLALTGKLAFTGTAQAHGLELAIEHINKAGGINGSQLRLDLEDNAGDPKQAVSGIRKQLSTSNAKIYYIGFTHLIQAVASPLAEA